MCPSSVSGLIVRAGSPATGALLGLGLPSAVPWLVLAALPALAVFLLPRPPHRVASEDTARRRGSGGLS
ncbi:hypothetical protein AB0M11_31460 [Streptomyces sp. NPDC051987]|uniref:hypothetical protein n=1 Tax=Streptomyces sp. NPDC051987 TaxID=3155808 RepID=UPI003420A30A